MTTIEKLNLLLSQLEYKYAHMTNSKLENNLRTNNLEQIHLLYNKLEIFEKHTNFNTLFEYKAMNLSGIVLKSENFGQIHKGKYIQIISIAYEPNSQGKCISKNVSLGYYGKAEKILPQLKKEIIEFVLRWRYEKSFQQNDHYEELLSKLHS